jgi:hypothetical protein
MPAGLHLSLQGLQEKELAALRLAVERAVHELVVGVRSSSASRHALLPQVNALASFLGRRSVRASARLLFVSVCLSACTPATSATLVHACIQADSHSCSHSSTRSCTRRCTHACKHHCVATSKDEQRLPAAGADDLCYRVHA